MNLPSLGQHLDLFFLEQFIGKYGDDILSFTKGLCIESYGQTPVCSLIFMFHIWEKTFKDERPHYLQRISGSAQGLATTATLPQRHHRRFLFCRMSYLLIYSSLLHPRLISYLSPIKINPHLKIPTHACQRGCNQRRDGLSRSPLLPLSSAQVKMTNTNLCL